MFTEQNFHLVGIGGIGMSGLARILRGSGKTVTGSDLEGSPITEKLQAEKFKVTLSQAAKNIPEDAEIVIHTLAAKEDNPELAEAQKRGLKVLSYPEALGIVTQGKKLIAVAGTHGKTTTTGLIIAACLAAGEDISCLVGTNLQELNDTNARTGESDWFVVEACEYKRAFLNLKPQILVITNIEAEHLDYYKDLDDYQKAFRELIQKLPENGVLVANSLEQNITELTGSTANFFDAAHIQPNFTLRIPGEHNVRNAKLAFVVTELLNLDSAKATQGIENFEGGYRRFEKKGDFNGAPVIDDYAHHPTEIRATLEAAREAYPGRRIVIVYQQHQLDRAQKMLTELGASFGDADVVVIPNIYEVRDEAKSKNKISGKDLAAEIKKYEQKVHHTENFKKTLKWLRDNIQKDDCLIIAGAGDVFRITEELLS
ncbi:MAG: Mur ligase family protein [Patescibacteria group bacterium]